MRMALASFEIIWPNQKRPVFFINAVRLIIVDADAEDGMIMSDVERGFENESVHRVADFRERDLSGRDLSSVNVRVEIKQAAQDKSKDRQCKEKRPARPRSDQDRKSVV